MRVSICVARATSPCAGFEHGLVARATNRNGHLMTFAPPPSNDFQQFIDTYHARCRDAFGGIVVIAGKWNFEDLIPGLSDFDTRFIVADPMSPARWSEMSLAVGRVHTELCREFPQWNRKLEHLPGLNLTLDELTDPFFYYPEFGQWTFYQGNDDAMTRIARYLDSRQWSKRDELFHLKKIATYFGPYQRGIDPAVNIGKWESKYALHSRYMHYFVPPMQSIVSLMRQKPVRGKMEALRLARQVLPNPRVIDQIIESVAAHYEQPQEYVESRLSEIERELDRYLREAYAALDGKLTLIEFDAAETRQSLAQKLSAVPIDPVESFFEGTKFCRLMKGRLLFFAESITWFDTDFLIRNELGRIVTNFYSKPLKAYGVAVFGQELSPENVLQRAEGSLLSAELCDGLRRFVAAASEPVRSDGAKRQARQVATVFEPVLETLELLGGDLRQRARTLRASGAGIARR